MSALGGDGANMAAKLLFKMGCTMLGLDGGYDARYGSEKKGTATDVSVRFCEVGRDVRQSGPTKTPHYIVAFHEDLITPLQLGRGLHAGAVCIVNTTKPPKAIRDLLRLHSGRVICIDASAVSKKCGSRLNMPLFAVLCHELGMDDAEVKKVIAKQWPRVAEVNQKAYDAALSHVVAETFKADGVYEPLPASVSRGPIGWTNMLNGGAIDALTHSTVNRDNRIAGRGNVPKFDKEACTSCGICLTVCSDPGGLVWHDGHMEGIDERFCKGCMRCVEVCPETKKGHALSV